MTALEISAPIRRMARPIKYPEEMLLRMPEGTKARLKTALKPEEDMADAVRAAVEVELKRRERATKAKKSD